MAIEARFALAWPGFALDVDLRLPARGVTALFGHSGSGKTTLLRCVAGLERSRGGRLYVDGECWQDGARWRPPHRRPLGYVFQDANLFPHLSVLDNLRYGQRRSRDAGRVPLEQAIALLGIEHLLQRRPERLSGGERQRVGIARALAVGPRLLLMDEPLAALDAPRKREILPYLQRLRDELAIPILYVSHALDEVLRLADHVVELEAGRVRAQGPLAQWLAGHAAGADAEGEAGVVLQGEVAERDPQWHLARVACAGGDLWLRDAGLACGRRVRVRVLARDVALAPAPVHSSVRNQLPGRLQAVLDDAHPALALARVQLGPDWLLAQVTRQALAALALRPGDPVWVQVKTAALLE